MDDNSTTPFEDDSGSTATFETVASAQSPAGNGQRKDMAGGLEGREGREESLHRILAAVVSFRDGDFSVRLPLNWSGIEGRIAEALTRPLRRKNGLPKK